VDDLPDAALFLPDRCSRAITAAEIRFQLHSSTWHRPWTADPELAGLVAEAVGLTSEIASGTRASPNALEKNNSNVQQAGGLRLEGPHPLAVRPAPDRHRPSASGLPNRRAHPFAR